MTELVILERKAIEKKVGMNLFENLPLLTRLLLLRCVPVAVGKVGEEEVEADLDGVREAGGITEEGGVAKVTVGVEVDVEDEIDCVVD